MDLYIDASRDRHSIEQMRGKAVHISRMLGSLRTTELRGAHCRGYVEDRRQQKIATGTIREELSKLRAGLRWAHKEGLIPPPPPIELPKEPKPRTRFLSAEEAGRLIEGATAHHIRLYLALALYTGARTGAILDLTWDRVDLARGVIDFGFKEGGKRRAVVPAKGALVDLLREAREAATTGRVVEFGGKGLRSIRKGFTNAKRRSGVLDVTPHDLRRTAGSWLIQAGVSLEVIAAMLGHSSIRVTQKVYAHLLVDHLRGAADALDAALKLPAGQPKPKRRKIG